MDGFGAYHLYTALKLHFNSNRYDFFKYNGKSHANKKSFEKRNERYYFEKLASKHTDDELLDLMVFNFVENPGTWVGDLLHEEGTHRYLKHLRVKESLEYTVKSDWEQLVTGRKPIDVVKFSVHYPHMLNEYLQDNIAIETVIICGEVLGFFPIWDQKITDTVQWPMLRQLMQKFEPFIKYDREKYRQIFISLLTNG